MNELSEMLGTAAGTVADTRGSWSPREWRDRASAARRAVGQVTTSERPLVAVTLPLSLDLLAMIRGAVDGGYSLLLVDPAAPQERRRMLLDTSRAEVEVDSEGVRTRETSTPGPEIPGYLAMSSGTTGGRPKGVLTPWSSIAAFAVPGAAALDLDQGSTWAEVTHPSYDLAMTNLLLAATSGAAVHVSASLADRLRPHAFVGRVTATHVRLAPRFADLVAAARDARPLRGLRVWGSGGDRLRNSHVEAVFAAGAATVVNTYGTSETAGFASAAVIERSAQVPLRDGNVTIGDGTVGSWSTRLRPGDTEMLVVDSPHSPCGYHVGESSDYPLWTSAGVVTGDVGARVGDLLFCLGRAGRRVKRHGRFLDLDALDGVVTQILGRASYSVVAGAGELVTLVESRTDAAGLRSALANEVEPGQLPDRVVLVPTLPRLGNGKIDNARAVEEATREP